MLYCKKCGVKVKGRPDFCPLCQGSLSGIPDSGEIFPEIKVKPEQMALVLPNCRFSFRRCDFHLRRRKLFTDGYSRRLVAICSRRYCILLATVRPGHALARKRNKKYYLYSRNMLHHCLFLGLIYRIPWMVA